VILDNLSRGKHVGRDPIRHRRELARGDRAASSSGLASAPSLVENCIVTRYIREVIKSFRHNGVERFFLKGSKRGIQPEHSAKLARQLQRLDAARRPQDMNVPGWRLHPLKGELAGHWAVSVSGNYRLTFRFDGDDAELVDYQDYH
jgi:proteic killer suppression protein